jgi:hypothetical protein
MLTRLNIPAGIVLFFGASIPALALAQSPPPPPAAAVQATEPAASPPPPLRAVPGGITPHVWQHALAAWQDVKAEGKTSRSLVTVIDYSRPATEKRLWVVDLATDSVLAVEYVAHGEGSGSRVAAERFSNVDGSHQSSLGTFITGDSFYGVRGRSLPLIGLEQGINDNAYARGLLIHGTPYVSEARALRGTMGLTEGCAGVPARSARRLIQLIGPGTVVFVWYPDRTLLSQSAYLDEKVAALNLEALD